MWGCRSELDHTAESGSKRIYYVPELRAIQTKNDGFDFKEGTHHIKVIGGTVDFQNTVPESTVGNNGIFMRANDVQIINTTVKTMRPRAKRSEQAKPRPRTGCPTEAIWSLRT